MRPINSLSANRIRRSFLLVMVMSVLVLTGCTLGESVWPNPAPGVAADRSAALIAPVPAPIPHTLDGREECFACHAIGAVDAPPVPADHDQDVELCTTCHAVWLAPAIAAAAPPAIPHEVEGRGDCLVCHKLGTADAPRVPDNHDGLTGDVCQTCHSTVSEIVGPSEEETVSITEAPPIPHGLEGFSGCARCHEEGGAGVPKFPDDHAGRTEDLCSACHSPQVEAPEAASIVEADATATEAPPVAAGDARNGEIVYAAKCAICHGDSGQGTAIAPDALNDAEFLEERTEVELVRVIREGVTGKMPPLDGLSDEDIADLVALLRSWE